MSVTNDTELMRDVLRNAVWAMRYHERALQTSHEWLAIAKAVQPYFPGVDFSRVTADDYDDDDNSVPSSVGEFVQELLAKWLSEVAYHEDALQKAHARFAIAKAMMRRGDWDIDIEAVFAQVAKQLDE